MMKIALLIFAVFLGFNAWAQEGPPPKVFNTAFKKGTYYIIKKPITPHARGVMVMLPGLTDAVYSPLFQSPLADSMYRNGYTIMIPVLSDDNMHLAIKDDDMQNLRLMLSNLLLTQFPHDHAMPIILGGMSVGGTIAIRFHQQYKAKLLKGNFNITRVYAVDPPLELARLHHSLKQMGDKVIADLLEDPFASSGSLTEQLNSFSPINDTSVAGRAFNVTKLRIYCEPDINWYLAHDMQVSDMNVVDCSAFYRQLKHIPDNQAELILTNNRGYRQPGHVRHPHAWSIIDVQDFMEWVL
ncbi:hypothetical protein [Mucilaginibacter sp. CSA2-8R]|uniref:hypothetical protein n=1 Tax=Mucilaginibacter sp. CSA2-8R TaxID=3141542 RepID=UPI00315D0955